MGLRNGVVSVWTKASLDKVSGKKAPLKTDTQPQTCKLHRQIKFSVALLFCNRQSNIKIPSHRLRQLDYKKFAFGTTGASLASAPTIIFKSTWDTVILAHQCTCFNQIP